MSATLSGTITSTATENDITAGGKTIVLTLSGDTWVASGATFDAQRQNIINGLNSDAIRPSGWEVNGAPNIPVTDVVRTSSTVVTITLSALASYDIGRNETITAIIPGSALSGGSPITATPTFAIYNAHKVKAAGYVNKQGFGAYPSIGRGRRRKTLFAWQPSPQTEGGSSRAGTKPYWPILVNFVSTSTTFTYSVSGGFQLGGTASPGIRTFAKIASGGFQLGGTAGLLKIMDYIVSGGFQLGGTAALSKGKAYPVSGGIQLAGTASPGIRTFAKIASGGLQLSGTASPGIRTFAKVASGGISLSGIATLEIVYSYIVSGGHEPVH
jgi:hypothetical protein